MRLFLFVVLSFNRSQEDRCRLGFRHVSVLPARGALAAMHLAVWPFVVALRLTAAVKPAEVTQRTSPLLILFCGFAFIAEAWSSHLWLNLMAPK